MKVVLAITLWFPLFFILKNTKFAICVVICRENEQQALDTLKIKELHDPSDLLSSWVVGKDCCEWKGVVCDNLTRHVIELSIWSVWYDSRYLRIDSLEWLPSLSSLENLDMESVDLSKANEWLQAINMLPSLVDLRLFNCSLNHITPLLDHHNFSSLKSLHLSGNNDFSSSLPKRIFNLPNLVSLDLSNCNFTGPFPDGPVNLSSLTTFKAYGNSFNSRLPKWLFDLNNLQHLELSGNLFEGDVSEFGNTSSLTYLGLGDNKLTGTLPQSLGQLSMLEYLYISDNRLEGVVTESHFSKLTHLQSFYASRNYNLSLKVSQNWIPPFQLTRIEIRGCNIGPMFPMWLQTQTQIAYVDISDGGIQGEVPTWFWNLSSQIQFLNLSHNQCIGEIPIISTPSWNDEQREWLIYLGSNNFSGPLPLISTGVNELDLSNNFFSKGLSNFLCHEPKKGSYKLRILNLGGNNLAEEIPDCWMNWPELKVLILRENNLIGGIPRSMEVLSNLQSLDLRRNKLNGTFPSSLENCTKLHKIDLAENEFIGKLPSWLGMKFPTLIVLSLRSNKFDGELPQELCHLKDLQILDLANNTFVGIIPSCIGNFSGMVKGKKKVEYDFDLNYSFYYGVVIESATVMTKGNMYQYDTILALFTSMDISSNNLSGEIPLSLTRLVGLRSLNFSKNNLTPMMPNDIGNMKVLESIDLSRNQFYGQIPQSLSSLFTLSYLNLSDNNLSGMIPLSTQIQTFVPSSFQGNKLCGLPLLVNCSSDANIPNHESEDDESEKDQVDWFYIAMAIGFSLSFWGLCGSLLFKRSWRHAYFRFLDRSWEMFLAKLPIC